MQTYESMAVMVSTPLERLDGGTPAAASPSSSDSFWGRLWHRRSADPVAASASSVPFAGYDETVLCVLKAFDSGRLEMRPGFSGTDWYTTQTDSGVSYEFKLVNLSEGPPIDASALQPDVAADVAAELRSLEMREALVRSEFTMPPLGLTSRYSVLGEIVSAHNFLSDNIYIEYLVDIPPGWSSEGDSVLDAVTQMCDSLGWNLNSSAAHFAFPFELEFLCNDDEVSPLIYFQVNSYDSWDRHRVLGYSYIELPISPGSHSFTVQCWKPFGNLRAKMAEFFVGGSPYLNTVADAAAYPDGKRHAGPTVNRYGFQVESTGSLRIRLNIVLQKGAAVLQPRAAQPGPRLPALVDPKTPGARSTQAILARAKERLAAARRFKKTQ
mmetsp:Transcript_7223/g.11938  ORF Transcript_7223/g.11938 Transcript_7223/m.11938 type:complete len:382 (-) Transcript_7223:807-1952(-)